MYHINLPSPVDQVSEDEVEITQIVKSAGGNITKHTAKAESLSNLNSLTSGPNLGLDERQKGIKDRDEDSSKENELEGTTIKKFAQGTALSNFTYGDLNKNSNPLKSGQTLDLDENDQDLEEIEKPMAKARAKSTPKRDPKNEKIERTSRRTIGQTSQHIVSYCIVSYRKKYLIESCPIVSNIPY